MANNVIVQGLGDAALAQSGVAAPQVAPLGVFGLNIADGASAEKLKKYRGGKHVDAAVLRSTTDFNMTLITEVPGWQLLGISQGEVERAVTAFQMPRLIPKIVPASGVVVVPEITATNLNTVRAGLEDDGGVNLDIVGVAPSSATEAQPAAGNLTLDPANAGKTVYILLDQLAAGQAVGGPNTTPVGIMEFVGEVLDSADSGADSFIWVPEFQILQTSPIDMQGGKIVLEMACAMFTPVGWDKPYTYLHDITWTDLP